MSKSRKVSGYLFSRVDDRSRTHYADHYKIYGPDGRVSGEMWRSKDDGWVIKIRMYKAGGYRRVYTGKYGEVRLPRGSSVAKAQSHAVASINILGSAF